MCVVILMCSATQSMQLVTRFSDTRAVSRARGLYSLQATTMRKAITAALMATAANIFAMLCLPPSLAAQQDMTKVKGGHQLGETAEQFFAEGYEKDVLHACAVGDLKGANRPTKHELKKYCNELADARKHAMSGTRYDYKGGGDVSEMRADTFTFDGGRLVKVELLFSAPSAEVNYRGHSFEEIFAGTKQAYGPPTTERKQQVRNAYGVDYIAHRELWLTSPAVIQITEQPGEGGSTTLAAFTRAEYDRTMAAGVPNRANPLQ
jgi:hypothetical protein